MRKKVLLLLVLFIITLSFSLFADAPGKGVNYTRPPYIDKAIFSLFDNIDKATSGFRSIAFQIARLMFAIDLIVLAIFSAFGIGNLGTDIPQRLIRYAIIMLILVNYTGIVSTLTTITMQIGKSGVSKWEAQSISTARDKYTYLFDQMEKEKKALANPLIVLTGQKGQIKKDIAEMQKQMDAIEAFLYPLQKGEAQTWYSQTADSRKASLYLSPDKIMYWGILSLDGLLHYEQKYTLFGIKVGMEQMPRVFLDYFTWVVAIIAFCICVVQYCIAILEFAVLASFGVLLIPFGLFKQTQFLIEKLIGALFGICIKVILTVVVTTACIYCFTQMVQYKTLASAGDITALYFFLSILVIFMSLSTTHLTNAILTGTASLGFNDASRVGTSIMRLTMTAFNTARSLSYAHSNQTNSAQATNNEDKSSTPSRGGFISQADSAGLRSKELGGSYSGGVAASIADSSMKSLKSLGSALTGSFTGDKANPYSNKDLLQQVGGSSSAYQSAREQQGKMIAERLIVKGGGGGDNIEKPKEQTRPQEEPSIKSDKE